MTATSVHHEPRHIRYRKPSSPDLAPLVVIVTGQHGNEPEGVMLGALIAQRFKAAETCGFDLCLFGAVNAWGLAHNEREMCPSSEETAENGRGDMNRSWRGAESPRDELERELWGVILPAIAAGRKVILLDLHSASSSMPYLSYAGPVGGRLRQYTPQTLAFFEDTAEERPGILTGAAEAQGVPALVVEASGGEPLGYLPATLWGMLESWSRA